MNQFRSFGFPYSLPQILIKSGGNIFLDDQMLGTPPPAFYYWQGLDGLGFSPFNFIIIGIL